MEETSTKTMRVIKSPLPASGTFPRPLNWLNKPLLLAPSDSCKTALDFKNLTIWSILTDLQVLLVIDWSTDGEIVDLKNAAAGIKRWRMF